MPRIRLEDVLLDVDRRCGFTRAFRPLAGYEPHGTDTYRALLATLIAHGTNLGLTAMGGAGGSRSPARLPLAGTRRNTKGRQRLDHRVSASAAVCRDLGRRPTFFIRWPALCSAARHPDRRLSATAFRLLRPGRERLQPPQRSARRVWHLGTPCRSSASSRNCVPKAPQSATKTSPMSGRCSAATSPRMASTLPTAPCRPSSFQTRWKPDHPSVRPLLKGSTWRAIRYRRKSQPRGMHTMVGDTSADAVSGRVSAGSRVGRVKVVRIGHGGSLERLFSVRKVCYRTEP